MIPDGTTAFYSHPDCKDGNQYLVRFHTLQTYKIIGISTNTPNTVARPAPHLRPKSAIAVATASSNSSQYSDCGDVLTASSMSIVPVDSR
jgi:hypothetical protein